VKLGKKASDTYAMLSKAYGGEAVKKSSVFKWHIQFKEVHKNWKMMKMVVQELTEPLKILKKCGI
jgi:hypothetical protein